MSRNEIRAEVDNHNVIITLNGKDFSVEHYNMNTGEDEPLTKAEADLIAKKINAPEAIADKPDEYEKAMQEAKVSLEVDVKIGGHYADVGNRINTVEQLALAEGRKQERAETVRVIEDMRNKTYESCEARDTLTTLLSAIENKQSQK